MGLWNSFFFFVYYIIYDDWSFIFPSLFSLSFQLPTDNNYWPSFKVANRRKAKIRQNSEWREKVYSEIASGISSSVVNSIANLCSISIWVKWEFTRNLALMRTFLRCIEANTYMKYLEEKSRSSKQNTHLKCTSKKGFTACFAHYINGCCYLWNKVAIH